jgi:hypothetical protein
MVSSIRTDPSRGEGQGEGPNSAQSRAPCRMFRRCGTAVLLGFALVGSAFAASPEVDARAAAEDARQAFAAGDFPRAIVRFEDARRLKPAPGLLFNLGQSHRRAGHVALAVSFFRRYLETNPPPAQTQVVQALLRELEPTGLLAPPPMPPLEGEPLWLPSTPTEFTLHPSPPPLLVTRWWFWTLIGAAAAGGAVALGVGLAPHPAPTSLSPIDAR